jgi:segregation and condensation protein B
VIDISQALIEVLLFVAGEPLTLAEICAATDLEPEAAAIALEKLKTYYEREERGLQLRMVAGGYQICTRPEYAPYVERLLGERDRNTLSQAALETLAIIAYKQPITKQEIENIRGVRVDSVLNRLFEKNLIKEKGRKDTPGRPILYGTTDQFLTILGLNDLAELPKIEV